MVAKFSLGSVVFLLITIVDMVSECLVHEINYVWDGPEGNIMIRLFPICTLI